jgi:predicted AlkP superfamily pyrophosphatase or phosphodiesterase
MITSILPFKARIGGETISKSGIKIEKIFDETAFTRKIKTRNFTLTPDFLSKSDFTRHVSENSKIVPFTSMNNLFLKVKKTIKNNSGKKYIFAYWPNFDHYAHEKGIGSKKAEKHLRELNKKIELLVRSIKGSNSTLIITADHGLLDVPKDRIIRLEHHPRLKECLAMSPCGEGRVAYFYVRPTKVKEFEKYFKDKLSRYCDLYKSEDIIKKGYFGLFEPNPKLFDRIGDYVLIMKENYLFKDEIEENPNRFIGHHGGVSKEEMLVPLIVIKA